jgi:hypothetical protein
MQASCSRMSCPSSSLLRKLCRVVAIVTRVVSGYSESDACARDEIDGDAKTQHSIPHNLDTYLTKHNSHSPNIPSECDAQDISTPSPPSELYPENSA